MGLKLIFVIMLFIFVSGCGQISCNKPYIHVGVSCCLDQNNDKVCDVDEKVVGVQDVTETEVYDSECTIGFGLDCAGFKVTKDNVQLTIQNSLERSVVIHKITLKNIDCAATFDETVFKGVQENFVIPCKLNKGSMFNSEFSVDFFEDGKSFTKFGELSSVVG